MDIYIYIHIYIYMDIYIYPYIWIDIYGDQVPDLPGRARYLIVPGT
jgi:hypothetical protein